MTDKQRQSKNGKKLTSSLVQLSIAFIFGCLSSATILLNVKLSAHDVAPNLLGLETRNSNELSVVHAQRSSFHSLQDIRILIAIAAFDFSQLPHFEEVIDSYQDLCVTGASKVDMVIHATGKEFVRSQLLATNGGMLIYFPFPHLQFPIQ